MKYIRRDNKFILICQHLWYVKRLAGIQREDKSTEKDENGAVNNTLVLLWKVHQFQAFKFDYFILIWVFILIIFHLSPKFLCGG